MHLKWNARKWTSNGAGSQETASTEPNVATSTSMAVSEPLLAFEVAVSIAQGGTSSSTDSNSDMIDQNEPRLWKYVWELCTHIREGDTIRGKQSRLTMWEILEHFDFLNGETT